MVLQSLRRASTHTVRAGILPVAPEDRTDRHYSKVFFVFFSANFNILSCVFIGYMRLCLTHLDSLDSRRVR